MESLKNLIKNVNKLPKGFHDKLYLMQYRRLQYWIEWQARRIAEDFARKVGKWVVEIAEDFGANVIKLESLKNLIKNVEKLSKEFHDKLYLMQYRRIQYWIEWQAKKRGMTVEFVNASYSSVSCPKCGKRMFKVSHRWFKCSCGYEYDRDVIAITNLNGIGL